MSTDPYRTPSDGPEPTKYNPYEIEERKFKYEIVVCVEGIICDMPPSVPSFKQIKSVRSVTVSAGGYPRFRAESLHEDAVIEGALTAIRQAMKMEWYGP